VFLSKYLIYRTRGIHCTVTNKFTIEYFHDWREYPNKLIEGEDYYTPEGYKCFTENTTWKEGIVVADAVIALMEPPQWKKKKNYEWYSILR
jgi:hypothetical protein